MAIFSVLMLTAAPAGQAGDGGGAFVKIDGREALLRSVELFLNRENVKQIQLVILPEMMEETRRKYGAHLGFSGVKLISGGPRWIDQMAAAGVSISAEATHVLVHDAARPAVAFSDIDALMAEAESHPAVCLATPVRTTLVEIDDGGNPLAVHLPGAYRQLLTPQAFSKSVFLEMAQSKTEIHPSKLRLLNGSPLNIRVGSSSDGGLVKAMIGLLPKPKMKARSNPFDEAQW